MTLTWAPVLVALLAVTFCVSPVVGYTRLPHQVLEDNVRDMTSQVGFRLLQKPVTEAARISVGAQVIKNALVLSSNRTTVGYQRLKQLTEKFGARPIASPNLESAIDWIEAEAKKDGFDRVWTEQVPVKGAWVRGHESLTLIKPEAREMQVLGLGRSKPTPPEGITAPVMVVRSFSELSRRKEEVAGKIVVFNVEFTTYSQTVKYRKTGGLEAEKLGAVAVLVRSVTPVSLDLVHTGRAAGECNIPQASITLEDAEYLAGLDQKCTHLDYDEESKAKRPVLKLVMRNERKDVVSRNVMGEIKGSVTPEEIVMLSGHIDSWDVGTGATDDGGGCVAAWEAVRIMIQQKLRPRRTVRFVLMTDEEVDGRGAAVYLENHRHEVNNTVFAMESDEGTYKPWAIGVRGSTATVLRMKSLAPELLGDIAAGNVTSENGDGETIEPLCDLGVPCAQLKGLDPRQFIEGKKYVPSTSVTGGYFMFHHTRGDTFDKVNFDGFQHSIATMSVWAYAAASMEGRLPRGTVKKVVQYDHECE
eukprot:GFYU01011071.1.p1 GENE.GFYU01011071.1~~GFYU01011071.1.p1  ORF type:complete len:555 (-),score=135.87 GFYU01011071.1:27-1616(-)